MVVSKGNAAPCIAKLRLLFIEDQRDLAANLAEFFEDERYELDFAADGLTALHLLSKNAYDVIVLDLMLPGVSGFEICGRIRTDLQCDTPIIVITARSAFEDKETCFAAGVDDYMVKPFDLRELKLRVEALSRRQNPRSRGLEADGVCFDPGTLTVYFEGRQTELSGTTARIFELLLRAHPSFITHEALSEAIWGARLESDSHTLRTHIYSLRQNLAQAFGVTMIKTIYGRGYRLVPSLAATQDRAGE